MPSDLMKIRVRSGSSEAEVEADLQHIREAIELIPEIIKKLPGREDGSQSSATLPESPAHSSPETTSVSKLPVIRVEKGDSLTDVISKFFTDPWGRSPRRLSDVREALTSYGLNYPKQSVAVSLLRLAKSSRIRRFKGDDGEFIYTASTGLFPQQQIEQTRLTN